MSLWKHKDFMKLWVGQTISEIGSRITREGLPLTAVLILGASPLTMSVLRLASFLPVSLLGLLVGVWVDRLPRRPLMMFADVLRGLLLLAVPFAALSGHLQVWLLLIVAALTGLLTLVFDLSYQAYIPGLVRRSNLAEANTKIGITASAAEVIGPGLTGLLVQALTAPVAILFDAVSYFASAFAVFQIHNTHDKHTAEAEAATALRDWRREVREGFLLLRQSPTLRALAGAAITLGFASSIMGVLYTLYAIKTLGMSPLLFGLTVTMGGIGSLIGAALSSRLVRRFGFGRVIVTMLFLYGATAVFIPLANGPLWRATLFMMTAQLIGDATGIIYEILDLTLRQTITSDDLLGRMNATIRVFEIGLTAVGSLVSGFLGEWMGIRPTMGIAAAGMVLATLWLLFSPIRRMRDLPEHEGVMNV